MAASKPNKHEGQDRPAPVFNLPGRRPRAAQPRAASNGTGRERVKLGYQIEKLVPQPQEAVALGLFTRNEAPIRSSTKSISEPAR
jgi:hypothetical protein